jgi:outer membrane biosynthesis protein TonB
VSQRVGFLVDVTGLTFDDASGSWIQAMPVGTYVHPAYGDLTFSQERLQAFAASVNNKVLQKDLDIDYDHKARVDHAAGWVQQAQVRDNGLWLYVTWTPAAQQKLQDKEYRYFSPEFQDEWTDPKTGITYKDVLFGGGLTNRPFLKDLVPINLSEMVGDTMGNENGTGGSPPTDAENMTQMARLLGLSGSVTSADIAGALQTRLTDTGFQPQQVPPAPQPAPPVQPQNITLNVPAPQPAPAPPAVPPALPAPAPAPQPAPPAVQPQLSDLLSPIKLTDDISGDPVALADVVRRQNERIQMLASATKLADAQSKVVRFSDPQTGIALAPAVRDLAIELLVKAPVHLSETVEKLLEAVAHGKATVVLGELGRSSHGSGNTVKQFSDAIDKARASDAQLTYAEALEKVSRENPNLANAYREATMAGDGEML